MMSAYLRLVLLAGVTAFLVGCSGGGTVPVTGKVTLKDGKSVTEGQVEFVTEDLKMSAIGQIEDGTYTLSTYGDNDGCPPGVYKVVVTDADPPVADEYGSAETSPLDIEVTSGKTDYPLELEGG